MFAVHLRGRQNISCHNQYIKNLTQIINKKNNENI